jgi:hypothetical protein
MVSLERLSIHREANTISNVTARESHRLFGQNEMLAIRLTWVKEIPAPARQAVARIRRPRTGARWREEPVMTTAQLTAEARPWVAVTERSDGHFPPFATAVIMFAVSAIVSILLSGLPH